MEIERKFRLTKLPDINLGEGVYICQGYVFNNNGEMRIRKSNDVCSLCVKNDGDLCRNEWETSIPLWVYGLISKHISNYLIQKTRYIVDVGGTKLEIDQYHSLLSGLIILECEFSSMEEAEQFELPHWAEDAIEVTTNSSFKNKNLSKIEVIPI